MKLIEIIASALTSCGVNPDTEQLPIEPQAAKLDLPVASPAQSPEEALAYLRSGRHIDGTVQWATQADLDAALGRGLAAREKANVGLGDDPDLFEGFALIGMTEDPGGWRGRTWADYCGTKHIGSPSG